jgi:hypothetical protein
MPATKEGATMKTNPNEPAFPVDELDQMNSHRVVDQHFGITIRDHFAAKALPAILGSEEELRIFYRDVKPDILNAAGTNAAFQAYCARTAYAYADAMLEARDACTVGKMHTPNEGDYA